MREGYNMGKTRFKRFLMANKIDNYCKSKINDYYKEEGCYVPELGCRTYLIKSITMNNLNIFIGLAPSTNFEITTVMNDLSYALIISEEYFKSLCKYERLQVIDFCIMDFIHNHLHGYKLIDIISYGVEPRTFTLFPTLITPKFNQFIDSLKEIEI